MLLEIILFLILGIVFGTFTGLVPGIHINLVGVSLIGLSATFLHFVNPVYLVVFIVAMAITHTFIDFIPSIFLGCPDTDTELSTLPGHEMLKNGQGYEAIVLTAYGSAAAIFILILIAFPSYLIVPRIYSILQKILPYILIAVSIILISIEKNKKSALLVFLLTGLLGMSVLNIGSLKEPLLPLLTGLFGASMLLISIKTKTKIPEQKITKPSRDIAKPVAGAFLGSFFASPVLSLLPGLGSGQAAIIGNLISKSDQKGFLVLLGATNTLVMGFSFVSLYLISRTRTGAAVAINELVGAFSWKILALILIVILFTGAIAFFITIFLAKIFSENVTRINYTMLSVWTLIILVFIVLIFSNLMGLIVLIVSAFTGIYCISLNVKRTQMMGCLLLPTILFYLI